MPRKLRVEYEGAIYHLINRGDHREDIFRDHKDRERFLETLGEACERTGWQVHSYCLMPNHFHLVVETPRPNLSLGMQWLLGTYTTRFNRRHKLSGHLFSGRYKSLLVDGSGDGYLKTVCDYVHLNPIRAKLLEKNQPLEYFLWSSYPAYLNNGRGRPKWLRVDRLLGEWGLQRDTSKGRRQFQAGMAQRCELEWSQQNDDWARLRRGWCLGSTEFRESLLERIEGAKGKHHHGAELRESDEQKALRLLKEMLQAKGWNRTNLAETPKGHRKKAHIARRLRIETTMTWPWIAEQLNMGHWRSAANAVRHLEKKQRNA
jgi:REP element-mobilizing transposase RayT